MRLPRNIVVFLVAAVLALPLGAQMPNGSITGLVLDPTSRAINGADILVINDPTGVKYSTKTNNDGIYVVPNFPPGPYRLQISKLGFKTLIKPDIVLSIQDSLSINFTLPVGAAFDSVTVEAGAPLINTESAAVGTVINRNFVSSLPLNGRSFNTLLQLTPGVTIAPSSADNGSPGQFSISGQRTDSNNFTIDGVSANFGVPRSCLDFLHRASPAATPTMRIWMPAAFGWTITSMVAFQSLRGTTMPLQTRSAGM